MTVRELIDRLWTLPQDAEVLMCDGANVYLDSSLLDATMTFHGHSIVYITDINPEDN